jgi:hypothetical protein
MGNRLARVLSVLVFTFLVGCDNDQGSQLTPEPQSRTPGPALDEDSPFAKAVKQKDERVNRAPEESGAVPKK